MDNYILRCLPIIEAVENCSGNFLYTIDIVCDNMCNLYNKVLHTIKPPKKYNYEEQTSRKINRSWSDSKIKYSNNNSDNPDAWEMLQIRLV